MQTLDLDLFDRVSTTLSSFLGPQPWCDSSLTTIHSQFQRGLLADGVEKTRVASPVSSCSTLPKEAEFYKTCLCNFYTRGVKCPKGSACTYAHGPQELRTYKTVLCREFTEQGICGRKDKCTFAHGEAELRNKSGLGEAIDRIALRKDGVKYDAAIAIVRNMSEMERTEVKDLMRVALLENGGEMPAERMVELVAGNVVLANRSQITTKVLMIISIFFSTVFLANVQDLTINLTELAPHLGKTHPTSSAEHTEDVSA
eukprot:c8062_g1_i1.p1 GENE.c8062_g1_i1~~c8062_g1_i1.p1  ORF type:complete len:257 (+),score=46.35 c8062_g1_i1:79-849(+)